MDFNSALNNYNEMVNHFGVSAADELDLDALYARLDTIETTIFPEIQYIADNGCSTGKYTADEFKRLSDELWPITDRLESMHGDNVKSLFAKTVFILFVCQEAIRIIEVENTADDTAVENN